MRGPLVALSCAAVIGGTVAAVAAPAAATQSVRNSRPEHIPFGVHTVKLRYASSSLPTSSSGSGAAATVHGKKAKRLVMLFDALERVPARAVHCDLAGGPETTVTFHGREHTWIAREAGCSTGGIAVTRDGKPLPTLQPSKKWTTTVDRDLRR
ncbi:MAG TPA: hypothetical protein VHA79_02620 [Mycobacteriales bacterium]|jgi:hypothetical protein|nr:hypothetical protein [Mycobacteriales bacterium]